MSHGPWHALDCVSRWMEQPTLLLPPCACLAVLITAGRLETPQADGTRQPEAHQGKFIWYSSTLLRGGWEATASPAQGRTTPRSPVSHHQGMYPLYTQGKGGLRLVSCTAPERGQADTGSCRRVPIKGGPTGSCSTGLQPRDSDPLQLRTPEQVWIFAASDGTLVTS